MSKGEEGSDAAIREIRAWAEDEYSLLSDRDDLRGDILLLLAHLAAVQQERDALKQHVDQCGLCWTVIGAVKRAQEAEAQLAALTAHLNTVLTMATAALGTVAMDVNVPRKQLRQIRDYAEWAVSLVPASSDGDKS